MYGYPLQELGGMVTGRNARRAKTYIEALRAVVSPDSVVLDIGTGFGFFAVAAAQLGARHVYGVEPNPVVSVGERLAAANGVADRVTFLRGLSTAVELPERANVLVSDIRGALPWHADHIPTIVDARERLLQPGAVLIPARDRVVASVVNAPMIHDQRVGIWANDVHGVDLSVLRPFASNDWGKAPLRPGGLLTPPQCWAELDYATVADADAVGELEWEIESAAVAHGLGIWFESELAPSVELSNAPGMPEHPIYGQSLFPFEDPVDLAAGDHVAANLRVQRNAVGNTYEYAWTTEITSAEGHIKASLAQATLATAGLRFAERRRVT